MNGSNNYNWVDTNDRLISVDNVDLKDRPISSKSVNSRVRPILLQSM